MNKEQSNDINKIVVVFSSCDKYKPLWDSFFFLFDKFMPKLNYDFYGTVSEDYRYYSYLVKGNHYNGNDTSFSTRLIHTLNKIDCQYFLFFLDDFFLTNPVDKDFLLKGLSIIKDNNNVKNVMMKDFVKSKVRCDKQYDNDFMIVRKRSPFKITTQISFFDKKYILSLLRRGESAWDFEMIGSYRATKKKDTVLYRNDSNHSCIQYYNAGYLHKGLFNPAYTSISNKYNIPRFDFSSTTNKKVFETNMVLSPSIFNRLLLIMYNLLIKSYNAIYPILSVYFKKIKKINKGYYPQYIRRLNRFDKKDEML